MGVAKETGKVTRAESKALTRQRILDEARRLFRERGYAATTLDQVADAAGVTKGAVYGHFAGKEDLLVSAIEAMPSPDFGATASDTSRPVRERMELVGRTLAADEELTADAAGLAVHLEFLAALLRNPKARQRYNANRSLRLDEMAAADPDEPLPGISKRDAWVIGHALLTGLQLDMTLAPEILTPRLFVRAFALLADLYPPD
jgi:AcrR family transcriptional regulator